MKKFLALMMAMMMAFSMAACGGEEAPVEEPVVEEETTLEDLVGDGGADGFTLWDAALLEVPGLVGTWNFCGGYMDDAELTQEELDATLEMYGGTLQFVLNEDGTAEMVQGGGSLSGWYEQLDDYSVGLCFDNNGEELRYAGIFVELGGNMTLVAMPDENGETGLYFQ